MRPNQLLDIEELETQDDGFGDGPEDSWAFCRREWFELKPRTGREREQADQMEHDVTHIARCPWFQGAHSGMRLRQEGRILHVSRVFNEMEQYRWLEWQLVETANGAA